MAEQPSLRPRKRRRTVSTQRNRTFFSDVEYEQARAQIIQRDYFPDAANETGDGDMPPPSVTLSAFHAMYKSEGQKKRTKQQQRDAFLKINYEKEQRGIPEGQPVHNALYFPPEASECPPPQPKTSMNASIHADSTRFFEEKPKVVERHWEGSEDDDEEETVGDESTILDDSVVHSIRSEIRQGQERRRRIANRLKVNTAQTVEIGDGYQVPLEGARDHTARNIQALRAHKRVKQEKKMERKRRKKGLSGSVRDGGSLNRALQASYRAPTSLIAKK